MAAFYDIHTHILPGIDDGARDMEETRHMLRLEREQGVQHIIATPHFTAGDHAGMQKQMQDALELAREAAREIDPAMTVDLGNELLHAPGMLEALRNGEALTLAGSRYILVEFLPTDRYSLLYHALRDYIMEGYIPIVAHMERYGALEKNTDRIEELIRLGACFQMNADSLVGGMFRRKAAYCRWLVEQGMIHFIASDCHHHDSRTPLMQDALAYLAPGFCSGQGYGRLTRDNPQAILADHYL